MLNQVRAALAALRLYRDPDRLDEVLDTVTRLADKGDIENAARGVRASSPNAEEAFRTRWMMRWNPEDLARCPEESFGRAVHDHCARWNIHPAAFPARPRATDGEYLIAHIENTHDVWHPVCGFESDALGEMGLQAFYMAQFPNLLGLFLLGIAHFRVLTVDRGGYPRLMEEVTRGWTLGKRARPLWGVPWDRMWERPLADVRRELAIDVEGVTRMLAPGTRELEARLAPLGLGPRAIG